MSLARSLGSSVLAYRRVLEGGGSRRRVGAQAPVNELVALRFIERTQKIEGDCDVAFCREESVCTSHPSLCDADNSLGSRSLVRSPAPMCEVHTARGAPSVYEGSAPWLLRVAPC